MLLAFPSFNLAPSVSTVEGSPLPGPGKLLESPAVAKTLQIAYHQLNSKTQKYEQPTQEERRKWEEYYAADQEELSKLLGNLQSLSQSRTFHLIVRLQSRKDEQPERRRRLLLRRLPSIE